MYNSCSTRGLRMTWLCCSSIIGAGSEFSLKSEGWVSCCLPLNLSFSVLQELSSAGRWLERGPQWAGCWLCHWHRG